MISCYKIIAAKHTPHVWNIHFLNDQKIHFKKFKTASCKKSIFLEHKTEKAENFSHKHQQDRCKIS